MAARLERVPVQIATEQARGALRGSFTELGALHSGRLRCAPWPPPGPGDLSELRALRRLHTGIVDPRVAALHVRMDEEQRRPARAGAERDGVDGLGHEPVRTDGAAQLPAAHGHRARQLREDDQPAVGDGRGEQARRRRRDGRAETHGGGGVQEAVQPVVGGRDELLHAHQVGVAQRRQAGVGESGRAQVLGVVVQDLLAGHRAQVDVPAEHADGLGGARISRAGLGDCRHAAQSGEPGPALQGE